MGKRMIDMADPITFAAECLRWLTVKGETPDPEDPTDAEEAVLQAAYASRIRSYLETHDPFEEMGAKETAAILAEWRRSQDRESVTAFLDGLFTDRPELSLVLLKAFQSTTTDVESGISRPGSFGQSQYDNLSFVADPEMVRKHVILHFKDTLAVPDKYPEYGDTESDSVVAEQFLWVHELRCEKRRADADEESPATDDGDDGPTPS